MKTNLIPRTLFTVAVLFLVFLWGFASSHFGWFPHAFLSEALDQGAELSKAVEVADHHLHPARHDLEGVVAYQGDERIPHEALDPEPGTYTLLSSYWPDTGGQPGLRLIDQAGNIVHHWKVDGSDVNPALADSIAQALRQATNYVHGSYLFENGDVLFNLEYLGLVRMNAAGDVIWYLDRRTHHSIHRAENGNFWVCETAVLPAQEQVSARFPGLVAPVYEDRVLEVTPEGRIVKELSVLGALYDSEFKNRLWTSGMLTADVLHLNDVEPLPADMADQYPLFEAGDLLVSMRNVSMLAVLDRDTGRIKWSFTGPILLQHDPDFIGDGWISIYDNNSDGTETGELLGGSRLVAIRPHTGERKLIYPTPGPTRERPFYSKVGGKAQLLRDGHWLITEATAGRVFEIDEKGRTVWEWGQQRAGDGGSISEVLEGTRYHLDPEAVGKWARP